MGVSEIAPGLYWSSIATDDRINKTEIDLGCYTEEGPAAVAHDLMLFKLNSSSGEQRRLPQVEDKNLVLSLSDYERVARDIIKELKRSVEELAVALKSKGLAVKLHNLIEHGGTPKPAAPAPAAVVPAAAPAPAPAVLSNSSSEDEGADAGAEAQPAVKRAVEPRSRKVLPPAGKRLKPTEEVIEKTVPAVLLISSSEDEGEEEIEEEEKIQEEKPVEKKKKQKTEKKAKKTTEPKSTASESPSQTEITRVWIKSDPEFPRKSGKYPCYVKAKPLQHGYFTIAQGVVKAILADFVHGNIELVSVDDPDTTWCAAYTVKDVEHRVPGNFKGSRYFTQIAALRKGLQLKEGDVLYFMKGEEPQQLKIGLWPQGSAEAETFTKVLIKDHATK